jgi:lysophospholipase L1-like esterase
MRWRQLAMVLLLPLTAARADGGLSSSVPNRLGRGMRSVVKGVAPPFARFLQTGAVAQDPDFCSTFTAHNTGNWVCMKNDATTATGSVALTVVSAPTAGTVRVCPNGSGCSAAAEVTFNGTANYLKTANMSSPQGDFSICALYEVVSNSGRAFVGKWSTNSFMFWLNTSPVLSTSDGVQTDASGGNTPVAGLRYFHCATFQYGGGATNSTGRIYENGAAVGTPNATMRRPQAAATKPIAFGAADTPAFFASAKVYGIYLTEKVLSATDILAAYKALVPFPAVETTGASPTFTNTATQTCVASDGTSVTVPSGMPCFAAVQNVSGSLPAYENPSTTGATLSFPNPISSTSAKWCASATVEKAGTWNFSGTQTVFAMGTTGAANSMRLQLDTNRNIAMEIRDSSNVAYNPVTTDWSAFSGPRQVGVCVTPGSTVEIWGDGRIRSVSAATGTAANSSWSAVPGTVYVGQLSDASTKFSQGRIGNLCFATSMSACQTTSPPTRTGATRSVAWIGDSITQGFGVTTSPPEKLEQLQGGTKYAWNYGVGGTTAQQMVTRWEQEVRGRGYTHLVVLAGVNDIRNSASAATVEGYLQTIYDEARADGLTLVPVTITPWKNYAGAGAWDSTKQTVTDAVNTWILAYCTTNGLTCANANAALKDGTDPQLMAVANDSGDHLHPNQTGADLLATTVNTAVGP